ncbi:MAG TPA: YbaN family protein [Steroidobacteraceae bacterium]|nr:YbaN family protein [Steroidobacteraceae bacterium]HRX89393.1 YbaN family protein [Steroidobacteraceae bacterium]
MVRLIWTMAGALALCCAVIGALLPVLPTTPFVLGAALAFAKGSPRARAWLTEHRTFGPIIAQWEMQGAIAPRYKRLACALMLLALGGSVLAGTTHTVLTIQLICTTFAAAFILSRPNGDR